MCEQLRCCEICDSIVREMVKMKMSRLNSRKVPVWLKKMRLGTQVIIGPFTYFTHIAVHYLSYTVHQISLYGSVQSQQSLFIAYWLYICVYKC